jgi:uncharacterized ParB-like nuclease family protein
LKKQRAEQKRAGFESEQRQLDRKREEVYRRRMQEVQELKDSRNHNLLSSSYQSFINQDSLLNTTQTLRLKDEETTIKHELGDLEKRLSLRENNWKNQLTSKSMSVREHTQKVDVVMEASRLSAQEEQESNLRRTIDRMKQVQHRQSWRAKTASTKSKSRGASRENKEARHLRAMDVLRAELHQKERNWEAKDNHRSRSIERTREAMAVYKQHLALSSATKSRRQSVNYHKQKAEDFRRKELILQHEKQREEVTRMLSTTKDVISRHSVERCHILNKLRGTLRSP